MKILYVFSGPYVEIDIRSGEIDGYDAIFLSPHKFLGGPGSPGILLMRKVLYQLESSPPSTCGGGIVNYVNGFNEKDTLYVEDIEERENGGTPQIIQTLRAALAFWVKEYIGYQVIEKQEHTYIEKALERLLLNQNICILGNTSAKRQAILSFLIYSTSNSSLAGPKNGSNGPSNNTDSCKEEKSTGASRKKNLWASTPLGYISATIRSSEPAPTAIGEGSGDIGKKINHGGGDVDGDEDDYFDDGDEGDGGGLFRRQKFLEERMAGHRHLICCSASSLLCNKIFLKICCISLSSTKLE
nr:putative cysteine desulfurase [Quercus suber]